MDAFISLDIGGTNIRGAVFTDNEFKPYLLKKIPTNQNGLSAIDNIKKLIHNIWPEESQVIGISAAAPGSINVNEGIVILAPNIPGWKNIPLGKVLSDEFSVDVFINNDARLAAYGEWKFGAGIGHRNLIYFTVSTGIGGGVIVDGRILEGNAGIATELGHISLVDGGPICGCGQNGHLEALSSGSGIEQFIANAIRDGAETSLKGTPSAKMIAQAANEGDELARSAFEQAGFYLGRGIANYLHIFNPSCVIFGGGVTNVGDLLFKPLRQSLEQHVMNERYLSNLDIKMASLGDNAGLIGALAYMRDKR